MPKKAPRNSYYFFMIDFREEQKKKGIVYQNMAEVQQAADPAWRQIHPTQRAKYEAMAKKEKERLRGAPDQKFTSNGISFAEIEAQQRAIQEIQEQEIADIKNFVSQKNIDNMLLEEEIFLIDVNAYCFAGNHYYMAECTVLRFSILEGVKDTYHWAINPGPIPIGYASDVKQGASALGLEMPNEEKQSDYMKVLAIMLDYLRQKHRGKIVPAMYTTPEKVEQVQDFIRQLCLRAGEDESSIRVYRLDTLFFYLANSLSQSKEDGYPQPTLATAQLRKDSFKYTPGLACELHEGGDKAVECSKSRVQRWAYTVLDKCCLLAAVRAVPGKHLPYGNDLEEVLTFREENKKKISKEVCHTAPPSTCGSLGSSTAWIDRGKKLDTARPSLRMPKADYSQSLVRAPDLNLSDSNFPKLGGAGRGRGLARSFDKMSLNK